MLPELSIAIRCEILNCPSPVPEEPNFERNVADVVGNAEAARPEMKMFPLESITRPLASSVEPPPTKVDAINGSMTIGKSVL